MITTEVITERKQSKKTMKNSHHATYEMYKQGKELSHIANARELSLQTVENHLIRCFEEGMEVDWPSFVPKEYESMIETAIEKAEGGLKAIKEQLPDHISYFMIRAYLQMNK